MKCRCIESVSWEHTGQNKLVLSSLVKGDIYSLSSDGLVSKDGKHIIVISSGEIKKYLLPLSEERENKLNDILK